MDNQKRIIKKGFLLLIKGYQNNDKTSLVIILKIE